ncbi:MAG: 4Fe-4S dicluster domain-containing protein [bacterium]
MKAMLIDITKCIGCEACVYACKDQNKLPEEVDPKLTDKTWTVLEEHKDLFVRKLCMHCKDPACASVCPVGAFRKTEEGAVVYDGHKCIGCRYCMVACPFSIPKYEWDKALPLVQKCIFCFDRISKGEQPTCAEVCPTEATLFGDRDDLLREAKMRIRQNPDLYVDHIFGAEEVGGTCVLYLSSVPFKDIGFRTDLTPEPLPRITWKVMSLVPNVMSLAGVGLLGTWWIINRRIKLDRERAEQVEEAEAE